MTHRWIVALLLLAACAAGPASAQVVDLRFDPPDTTIEVGGTFRMSIMVDDPLEFRTIDVHVQYDTTVVRSLGGGKGALYTESGINTFSGFEEDSLGLWHGYAILMAADRFVQGPGELFYWDLEGPAVGVSPIISTEVYVSRTDGSWYSEVNLPETTVRVASLGPAPETPSLEGGLRLWPNPFNPRVHVGFELAEEDWVRLEVHDARGRLLGILHDGPVPAGPFTAAWDGRDRQGHAAPGGVYLFRLVTQRRTAFTRGVLLR